MKRVLIVTDPHVPTPPVDYGGTERIAWLVATGLADRGLKVDLVGAPGSKAVNGKVVFHRKPGSSYPSRALTKIKFQLICMLHFMSVDAVVNFGRADYLLFLLKLRKRVINVFQNPVNNYEDQMNFRFNNIRSVGISKEQIKDLAARDQFKVIYNAVDTSFYKFRPEPGKYLVFLGRLTYNKGVDIAIRVAKAVGLPLVIAGNLTKEEGQEEFVNNEVKKYFDDTIRYIGPVNDEQKNELLGNAMALLFPIRWSEPFGIVMVESLACGTPVIAMKNGSVTEVIDDGITGFICETEDQMIGAVSKLKSIDRLKCRESVERRFSKEVMVQQYHSLLTS